MKTYTENQLRHEIAKLQLASHAAMKSGAVSDAQLVAITSATDQLLEALGAASLTENDYRTAAKA